MTHVSTLSHSQFAWSGCSGDLQLSSISAKRVPRLRVPSTRQLQPNPPITVAPYLHLNLPGNAAELLGSSQLMATASTSNHPPPPSSDPTFLSLTSGLEYFIGPVLPLVNASPIRHIREHLAKRIDTDEFYTMKILTLTSPAGDSSEDSQGKILMHNENSILLLLQGIPGVVQHHGLFREKNKIILLLDCIHSHSYDGEGKYTDFVNLQQYTVKQKRLGEREALRIFQNMLTVIEAIHEVRKRK